MAWIIIAFHHIFIYLHCKINFCLLFSYKMVCLLSRHFSDFQLTSFCFDIIVLSMLRHEIVDHSLLLLHCRGYYRRKGKNRNIQMLPMQNWCMNVRFFAVGLKNAVWIFSLRKKINWKWILCLNLRLSACWLHQIIVLDFFLQRYFLLLTLLSSPVGIKLSFSITSFITYEISW